MHLRNCKHKTQHQPDRAVHLCSGALGQIRLDLVTHLRLPTGVPSFEATPDRFVATTAPEPGTEVVGSSFPFVQVNGAIPDLSTWAMTLLGFAGLGLAGYRKAQQAAVTNPRGDRSA